MAKIRDSAVTIFAAATANMVCEMPVHEAGDLLLAFVNKDTASAFTTPSTTVGTPVSSGNWTLVQAATHGGAAAGGIYARRATSSTENVTFPLTSETCCALVVSVKNVFGTTVADALSASSTGTPDNTPPYPGGSVTTAHTNTLVFSMLSTDLGIGPVSAPGWVNLFNGDAAANSLGVAYLVEKDITTVTGPTWYGLLAAETLAFMVAVRDDGTEAEIDAYIPPGTTPSVLLAPLDGTAVADFGTWIAANQRQFTPIAGKTVTGLTVTSVGDTGYNPFRSSAQTPGSSSTTNLGHTEFTPTTAYNLTGQKGIIFGTFRPNSPRDYIDLGTAARGGAYFVIGSAAQVLKAWVVGGQFSQTTKPDKRQNWAIQVNQTSNTAYSVIGSLDLSSVSRIAIGSSGFYGAPAIQWNLLFLLNEVVLAGGSSTSPFRFSEFVKTVNNGSGLIPLVEVSGSSATLWAPIRFGGVEPCHVLMTLRTLQYPRKADKVDYLDWHIDDNYVGIEFYGLDGDSFSFRNCTFTSESPYYWRFNASHSANATIDFSGSTIVNGTVTLQPTVDLEDVIFNTCGEIEEVGGLLTECTFVDTRATSTEGAVLLSDSTQTGLQNKLNNFVNCIFTNNISSNAAIKILYTGTGNVTLDMTSGTFSGNSKDIAWWAPPGSNLTINVSGTANPTSNTTTNNNSVFLVNTKTFTVQNIVANTEIRIYQQSNMTELAAAEDVGNPTPGAVNLTIANDTENTGRFTATYSYNYTADIPIYIVAHSLTQQWLRSSATLKSTNGTLKIAQIPDRQYQNP